MDLSVETAFIDDISFDQNDDDLEDIVPRAIHLYDLTYADLAFINNDNDTNFIIYHAGYYYRYDYDTLNFEIITDFMPKNLTPVNLYTLYLLLTPSTIFHF